MASGRGTPQRRAEICRQFNIRDEMEAYKLISTAAKSNPERLRVTGLRASQLTELGYDLNGMRKLGFKDDALELLGYNIPTPPPSALPSSSARSSNEEDLPEDPGLANLAQQVRDGMIGASELKRMGYNVHHLRKSGCMIGDLERAGYQLDELVLAYGASELRRAGYGIRELKRYFKGPELKQAGFQATDMRNAGYGIRELLNYGYNENEVKGAGFSINELSREGLTRQTVDKTRLR